MYNTTGFTRDELIDICVLIASVERDPDAMMWPPCLGLFKSVVAALAYMRHNRTQAETQGRSEITRRSHLVTLGSRHQGLQVGAAAQHPALVTMGRLFSNIPAKNRRWPPLFLDYCCYHTNKIRKRRPSSAILPFSGRAVKP
jgi:hypothetical protein